MIYEKVLDLIGNTPLLHANKYGEKVKALGDIYTKLEYYNPAGSVKDRAAREMIYDLYKRGKITSETILVEPTSGNTGIALASICAYLGLKMILVMPESMSIERRKLMKAYNAEIILTKGSLGMNGAVSKAYELAVNNPNVIVVGQFENVNNAKAHYLTTGPELYEDLKGEIDILICGIGTGGTISGTGSYLKEKLPNLKVIGVEPADSPLLSTGKSGPHKLQGLGANFIPTLLDQSIYDELLTVTTKEAYEGVHEFAECEGIFVGISSGAALHAAKIIARRSENKGKKIVVILPDGGDRYLSTDLIEIGGNQNE